MMDPSNVEIKFKDNKKGTQVVAYCEEYPEIQGIGPNKDTAVRNFWRAFNNREAELEQTQTEEKKKAA